MVFQMLGCKNAAGVGCQCQGLYVFFSSKLALVVEL